MAIPDIGRRAFITLLGGAAVAPFAVQAQQPALPIVGLLRSTPAAPFAHLVTAVRQGLSEEGFTDGQSVVLEQHWADNQLDRLPGLAADLVRRKASVIVGNVFAVEAARAATSTIPIVFVTGEDPIMTKLVTSMSRPESNLTGVTFFGGAQLDVKRLELLRDLVPGATVVGVLGESRYLSFEPMLPALLDAARALGRTIVVERASDERDFEPAFARMVKAGAGAVLVSGTPFFTSQRRTIIGLAERHAIPAIYDVREWVADGGLISFSASLTAAWRQGGVYAGKILKGATPSELPVLQPTTFELAVNLRTAKALGIDVPPSIHLRADEVVE